MWHKENCFGKGFWDIPVWMQLLPGTNPSACRALGSQAQSNSLILPHCWGKWTLCVLFEDNLMQFKTGIPHSQANCCKRHRPAGLVWIVLSSVLSERRGRDCSICDRSEERLSHQRCLWQREAVGWPQGIGVLCFRSVRGKHSLQTRGRRSRMQLWHSLEISCSWKCSASKETSVVEGELKWEWEYDSRTDKLLCNFVKLKFLCSLKAFPCSVLIYAKHLDIFLMFWNISSKGKWK